MNSLTFSEPREIGSLTIDWVINYLQEMDKVVNATEIRSVSCEFSMILRLSELIFARLVLEGELDCSDRKLVGPIMQSLLDHRNRTDNVQLLFRNPGRYVYLISM